MSHGACWIRDEDVVLVELRYFIKALDCRRSVFLELSCCVPQLWWNIAIRVSVVGKFDSVWNGVEIFQGKCSDSFRLTDDVSVLIQEVVYHESEDEYEA